MLNKLYKMRNKKGFTLMEMLIVVAIIAILIAIAIPVFTTQLNTARLATDHANTRSALTYAKTAELTGQMEVDNAVIDFTTTTPTNTKFYFTKDGNLTATKAEATCYRLQGSEAACTSNISGTNGAATHVQNAYIVITYVAATGAGSYATFTVTYEN